MLVATAPSYSAEYLRHVEEANFTDKVEFEILNEGFLREQQATTKLKSIELNEFGYDKISMPDDIYCTGIFGSFGTLLTPMTMDMRETPTFQYMGGSDTHFYLTFETMNRDAVAILERLYATLERYSRQYRDKVVTGYMKINNSLVNLCGVRNAMIQDITISTVPQQPDLFRIQMSIISFKDTQYQDQRLRGTEKGKGGFNMVSTKDAEEVAKGNLGVAENYLGRKDEPWFITEEGIAEGMLDQLELYPDLELPTYKILNEAITKINKHRRNRGFKRLPITSYKTPRHLYLQLGEDYQSDGGYITNHLPDSTFVDPDFYFTYPEWKDIKWVDTDMIDEAAFDVQLGLGAAWEKKSGSANYNIGSASSMPSFSAYKGSMTGPHHGQQATRLKGTDKWNDLIYEVSTSRGVNPVFVKVLMAIETGGTVPSGPNAFNCWGLMQVQQNSINRALYDWNAFTKSDPASVRKQLNAGIDVIFAKLQALASLQKKHPNSRWTNNPELRMVANLYYGDDKNGRTYGEWAEILYVGFGYSKHDSVKGGATGGAGASAGSGVNVSIASSEILENAEADILMPIPRSRKDEKAIELRQQDIQAGFVMRSMLHDMAKYSRRGTMNRAFPTFCLVFVDEGMWVDYRRLWNNYYTYHAIEEITLVKERNNPVETAYLRLQNIYGALNSTVRPDYKAAQESLPGWTNIFKHPIQTTSAWYRHWFPAVDENMVKQRMEHIDKSGFYLRAGARVHLRMGYGSVASMMPTVFNGRVTEVDASDVAEVICQSDGLELIEQYHEWGGDSRRTWYNMYQEPKDIIDDFLVNRQGWDLLAGSTIWGTKGTVSKYGIEHFGYVIADDSGFWKRWFVDSFRGMFGGETVFGYDARKNIYAANGKGEAKKRIFDKERAVHFWQTDKSPWDVMQILTSITPDYELKIHEHNFHSTLFYGEPQWFVKYRYYLVGKDTTAVGSYREAMKTSQQFHQIDSRFDIINNSIKASGNHLCTIAVPIFSFDEKPRAAETIHADPNIKPEFQKTDIVDTSLLQDFPMGDWIQQFTRWAGSSASSLIVDLGQGVGDIVGKILGKDWSKTLEEWDKYRIDPNSRTQQFAIEAAKTHIQWKFREMYQGEVVVLGDSAIRPGDIFNLSDIYTQMYGQAEVGRVVHVMGMSHGFTTSVKPDLLSVRNDGKRAKLLHEFSKVGTYLGLMALRGVARRYIFKRAFGMTAKLTKSVGFIQKFKNIRNTASAKTMGISAAAGPKGWILLAGQLGLWAVSEMIVNSIERMLNPSRAGVMIMPLWWKNRPYVAGIDGHKELIPGYHDENVYGELTEPSSHESSQGGGAIGVVPPGFQLCAPTKNHRVTSHHRNQNPNRRDHKGTDYGPMERSKPGDPILAVANGTVRMTRNNADGYGLYVVIEHDLGRGNRITWDERFGPDLTLQKFYTLYAHLQNYNVSVGQTVHMGQEIGRMGHTGRSIPSGPAGTHLHFEMRTAKLLFASSKLPDFFKCTDYDPEEFFRKGKTYYWK